MKVGDMVSYHGHKAVLIAVEVHRLSTSAKCSTFVHTLHFLNDRPSFLKQNDDGFFTGFGRWELKLVSER